MNKNRFYRDNIGENISREKLEHHHIKAPSKEHKDH